MIMIHDSCSTCIGKEKTPLRNSVSLLAGSALDSTSELVKLQ